MWFDLDCLALWSVPDVPDDPDGWQDCADSELVYWVAAGVGLGTGFLAASVVWGLLQALWCPRAGHRPLQHDDSSSVEMQSSAEGLEWDDAGLSGRSVAEDTDAEGFSGVDLEVPGSDAEGGMAPSAPSPDTSGVGVPIPVGVLVHADPDPAPADGSTDLESSTSTGTTVVSVNSPESSESSASLSPPRPPSSPNPRRSGRVTRRPDWLR